MKVFLFSFFILASALANLPNDKPHVVQAQQQFTDHSSTNGWNSEPLAYSSSTFTKAPVYESVGEWTPVYDDKYVPATTIGGELINTALNTVLGLFIFSVIVQIVTKIVDSPLFDTIFTDARSLSSDDMVMYANMLKNAYDKFEKANSNED